NGGSEVTINSSGVLTSPSLVVSSNSATVSGKNIVRSVNGTAADASGNVTISTTTTSASLTQNGWYKDNNTGMITQWGYLAVGDDSYVTVTLPIPYPNACLNLQVTGRVSGRPDNDAAWASHGNILSNSQIAVGAANPNDDNPRGLGVYWTTIGY
ncbi:gp53-like domain-containing protein, partial [Escherichia coli]